MCVRWICECQRACVCSSFYMCALPKSGTSPTTSTAYCCTSATTFCTITRSSCHYLLLFAAATAAVVVISDYRVCMCAYVRDTIREHLLVSSSLFLYCFTRALALSSGPTTKCSLNYATTVFRRRVHEWRWCVCPSDCLLVGTGADRKITTADQPRCLHFSNCPTLTHTLFCAPSLLCLCFGKIFDKKTIVNDTAVLGSLASHAHYHGTAAVLAAVFGCTCSSACACVCVLLPNSM